MVMCCGEKVSARSKNYFLNLALDKRRQSRGCNPLFSNLDFFSCHASKVCKEMEDRLAHAVADGLN